MTEEHSERYEIKKLNILQGKNFSNWKFRIQIILKEHEIESFLTKSVADYAEIQILAADTEAVQTEKNKQKCELEKKERKCHSLIVQRIHDDYLEYIKDKATPKEVWAALISTFERKGVANRMFLRRELLTLKMNEGDDLEKHLLKFDKLVRDLKSAGAKMEDEDIVCHLLITLPKSYESVVTALETMKIEELNIEFVKGRLMDSDIKNKTNSIEESEIISSPYAMAAALKKDLTCFNCGKKGHYKVDCKQPLRDTTNRRNHHEAHMACSCDDEIAF